MYIFSRWQKLSHIGANKFAYQLRFVVCSGHQVGFHAKFRFLQGADSHAVSRKKQCTRLDYEGDTLTLLYKRKGFLRRCDVSDLLWNDFSFVCQMQHVVIQRRVQSTLKQDPAIFCEGF